MPKIKVQVLNFHALCSHIEILLENTSVIPSSYYSINRWEEPQKKFTKNASDFESILSSSSSAYTFYIDADPNIISKEWCDYFYKTFPQASIFGNNCAVASQWFLNKFANIPDPDSAPVSLNHLIFGIFVPSSIPIGITLPGRIMDNAKFHIVSEDSKPIEKHSSLLTIEIALEALKVVASPAVGIAVSLFLSENFSPFVMGSCFVAGALSIYGLFKSTPMLEIRKVAESSKDNTLTLSL